MSGSPQSDPVAQGLQMNGSLLDAARMDVELAGRSLGGCRNNDAHTQFDNQIALERKNQEALRERHLALETEARSMPQDGNTIIRKRDLESRINELQEQIVRSKTRASLLKGGIYGSCPPG
jgi:hypothetical protein